MDPAAGAPLPPQPPLPAPVAAAPAPVPDPALGADLQLREGDAGIIKPTDDEQKLSSLAFLKAIGERNGFELKDINSFKSEILDLDKAAGKNHLQGTVRRTFYAKGLKYTIEQKINVGVRAPNPNTSEPRILQEAKMRALFAIDGHEKHLEDSIKLSKHEGTDQKIQQLLQKTNIDVEFRRQSKSEGFYGKAIRWLQPQDAKTTPGKISKCFFQHGSIKGVVVDGKDKTEAAYKKKWDAFNKIPCTLFENRTAQIKKITEDAATLLKGPDMSLQTLRATLDRDPMGEHKQKLDAIKALLTQKKDDMDANALLNTIARELGDSIDEFALQISKDRWGYTDASNVQNLVSHKDIGADFGLTTKDLIKELNLLKQQLPDLKRKRDEAESSLGDKEHVEAGPAAIATEERVNAARALYKNTKASIKACEKQLWNMLDAHEKGLEAINDKLKAIELLLEFCPEAFKASALETHKKNLAHLKSVMAKEQLSERIQGFRRDLFTQVGGEIPKPPLPPPAANPPPPADPLAPPGPLPAPAVAQPQPNPPMPAAARHEFPFINLDPEELNK